MDKNFQYQYFNYSTIPYEYSINLIPEMNVLIS